jgi:hypothetical protein
LFFSKPVLCVEDTWLWEEAARYNLARGFADGSLSGCITQILRLTKQSATEALQPEDWISTYGAGNLVETFRRVEHRAAPAAQSSCSDDEVRRHLVVDRVSEMRFMNTVYDDLLSFWESSRKSTLELTQRVISLRERIDANALSDQQQRNDLERIAERLNRQETAVQAAHETMVAALRRQGTETASLMRELSEELSSLRAEVRRRLD